MNEERHSANSPSGAIRLVADETTLEITGDITPGAAFTVLSTAPGFAIAGYLIFRSTGLLSSSAIFGYAFLAISLWYLNSTRRKTVLHLTRDSVELTETLLFSNRLIRARIKGKPIAAVDAIHWEEWREDLLRLRTEEGSHLYILKRHSVEDLRWVGMAIEQRFDGGPRNVSALATPSSAHRP